MDKNSQKIGGNAGFTLIELLITLFIMGFVLTAIISTFVSQDRIHKSQDQVAAMQQNLRAVMYMMAREIRMAGYDEDRSGGPSFGIDDIKFWDAGGGTSFSSITFSAGTGDSPIQYRVYDNGLDNTLKLVRLPGTDVDSIDGNTLKDRIMAENIEDFCIAYAFDGSDPDKDMDTDANGNIIWAVDTNNDNRLDTNLDADNDGDIEADDVGGVAISPVDMEDIRAVRIWVLGKVEKPDPNYSDNRSYVVGGRVVQANDRYRRRLLETVVRCRNML